ncbi:MAG TPA: TolC family protein [Polyangiaceae bacterium]
MNSRWKTLALALLYPLSLSGTACVSERAGYDDVRRTTAARLQKDVRWHAVDAQGSSSARTRELLARPLDAESAVQVALLNNAGLQAGFEDLGEARAELVAALALPNPTVDASLRFHGEGPASIELHALESISGLLLVPAKNGAASRSFDAARAGVVGKILDLALEVKLAFYAYQAAAERLELERQVLGATRAAFDMAQRLHDAGNVTELALASEQAFYEESRVAFARAEAETASQREALTALLGVGHAAAWRAEQRLPQAAPVDELLQDFERRALVKSLDLEIVRLRYEAAAKKANVARFEGIVPELSAGVAAEREGTEWSVGPAVALEIPIFDQGQAEVDAALSEMRRERKLHTETATRLRGTTRALAARLRAAAESAEFYRLTLLPLRARIVEQMGLEVNVMNAGLFQLLQSKRELVQASQAYVELLLEYWSERARAEQLLLGRQPRGVATSE